MKFEAQCLFMTDVELEEYEHTQDMKAMARWGMEPSFIYVEHEGEIIMYSAMLATVGGLFLGLLILPFLMSYVGGW